MVMHPNMQRNDNNSTKDPQMESTIEVLDTVVITRDLLLENEFVTKFTVIRA